MKYCPCPKCFKCSCGDPDCVNAEDGICECWKAWYYPAIREVVPPKMTLDGRILKNCYYDPFLGTVYF